MVGRDERAVGTSPRVGLQAVPVSEQVDSGDRDGAARLAPSHHRCAATLPMARAEVVIILGSEVAMVGCVRNQTRAGGMGRTLVA